MPPLAPGLRRGVAGPTRRQVLGAAAALPCSGYAALGGLVSMVPAGAAAAPMPAGAATRWLTSSDGVRLHYLEAGRSAPGQPTVVLVPGWTMPAWIWARQVEHLAGRLRVLAFDPRGQGSSAVAAGGYDYARRATDVAELLAAASCERVVLVGWSLGVLESLRMMHDVRGTAACDRIAGLVLVDNSVGEGTPPAGPSTFLPRLRARRRETVSTFVQGMFRRPQPRAWLDELTEAALRMPLQASVALLSQPTPREFWRETLYAVEQPVLYAHTPRFSRQAELVRARKPGIETAAFDEAGHALFVDEPERFNQLLDGFIARLPAPGVPTR
ncbi:MAG: alpha/beta fold hydrolase [Rubrivivax sp.]